ncbi:MAG: L-histidine N(alpha)-methyltransferase [Methylocystis sp.]
MLEGLSGHRKTLPCRFFYDARGSELFDQITCAPEYYLTRAETAILQAHATDIIAGQDNDAVLVEFGSGSSHKTEIFLHHLPGLAAYVPIDVSHSALEEAKRRLATRFPWLNVRPLIRDFTGAICFPADLSPYRKIGFFPGSTIGNFTPAEAVLLLRAIRQTLAPNGSFILGVDLKKDPELLLRAYNDSEGVTAAFNLNLLQRINRELGANFDLSAFRHRAVYNSLEGRIEMHLVSRKDQEVSVAQRRFWFCAGETIHTENSYKYTIEQFQVVSRSAGWRPRRVWIDNLNLFSVHELCQFQET